MHIDAQPQTAKAVFPNFKTTIPISTSMALLHNPKSPKHLFQISKTISTSTSMPPLHTPQTANANFPTFKIVRELIQDSEAWGTEVSFILGKPGTGAGGTGLPARGRLEICPGNRLPEQPEPISYLNCKNPKASLVGEKSLNFGGKY